MTPYARSIGKRLLAGILLFPLLFLFGCASHKDTLEGCACTCGCPHCANTPKKSDTESPEKNTETKPKATTASKPSVNLYSEKAVFENADFRILLTSDIHYTYRGEPYYGTSKEDRVQYWVDAVKAEHAKRAFDLIVIMGDVSLDHWQWQGGGSYIKDGISNTEDFMRDYVSQLPSDVPVFVLAGNHEQYGNAKWRELVGNDRQGSFVLGDNLFLFLDSFSDELDPDYHHDGKSTPPDADFIREQMRKYPTHKVYMISHYFDLALGGAEFESIVKDSRVVALFQGHTHANTLINLGADYGHKTIAQTGSFASLSGTVSENNFWGFRDLMIVGDRAVSRYIVAESDAIVNDVQTHFKRTFSGISIYN